MLKKVIVFIGCFILVLPLLSHGFDCNKPDFGAKLEDLNKEGYFVKYMEKAGISYYNYTGPCRMEIHSDANPSIAFAFVENQLYARISKFELPITEVDKEGEERIAKQIGSATMEKRLEGDWLVYRWNNEKEKLKYKVKSHNLSSIRKTAFYYEPLREKLKITKSSDDPASLED